jgi:hypothetical protein
MGMEPTPLDLFRVELDCRLSAVWYEIADVFTPGDIAVVAAVMRAAYWAGYADAVTEPIRGQLYREFGYTVPPRREQAK